MNVTTVWAGVLAGTFPHPLRVCPEVLAEINANDPNGVTYITLCGSMAWTGEPMAPASFVDDGEP